MKPYYFVSESDGALYDTRVENWSHNPPLRKNYARHHSEIESVADMKATLRAGKFTFPGCYELFFITSDGGALCFDCAKENYHQIADSIRGHHSDGWRVVACDIADLYESGLTCDHCNKTLCEAYADEEETN